MQRKIIIIVVCIILILTGVVAFNSRIETEYIPEIEIDENSLRKTMISLYYLNNQTNDIEKETRLIDSKELLKDPYKKVLEILMEGPEKSDLVSKIPKNTKVTKLELEDGNLNVFLTMDSLDSFENEKDKELATSLISETLKEFKEVNNVNVIIDENGM